MEGILKYSRTDTYNKSSSENLGKINIDKLLNSETKIAFITDVDAFTRAVNGLTTNTYTNSTITVTYDVNEILAE